jgi:PAS domain-containing protein
VFAGGFELDAAEGICADDRLAAGRRAFQPIKVDHVFPGEGERTLILDARPLTLPGHSERRVLVTFQDITSRKAAEAANELRAIAERKEGLRRSEAFLAEAQRLSSTGSFYWRVTTHEITWSERLYCIFEFDQSMPLTPELIGSRIHPEDSPLLHDIIERARGIGTDFECEYRLQMLDESVKYLHMVARGTRDEDGRLEYIGAVQDVTARRLSEQALVKAQSQLAYVTRATALSALTASIAHEVNQPLSGIITNASTCLRMLAAHPPDVEGARETARRTIRPDGMGIGLSISRSIIERHHGRLWAEANDGPGATLSFSVPSGPDAAPR